MIVGFCLFVMTLLSIVSMLAGGVAGAFTDTTVIDNTVLINGSSSSVQYDSVDMVFALSSGQQVILWIVIIVTLVSVIGIQIVGSGLDSEALRVIQIGVGMGGLWGALTVLSFPLLMAIEVFGSIIYLVLTIIYVIGVFTRGYGSMGGG